MADVVPRPAIEDSEQSFLPERGFELDGGQAVVAGEGASTRSLKVVDEDGKWHFTGGRDRFGVEGVDLEVAGEGLLPGGEAFANVRMERFGGSEVGEEAWTVHSLPGMGRSSAPSGRMAAMYFMFAVSRIRRSATAWAAGNMAVN